MTGPRWQQQGQRSNSFSRAVRSGTVRYSSCVMVAWSMTGMHGRKFSPMAEVQCRVPWSRKASSYHRDSLPLMRRGAEESRGAQGQGPVQTRVFPGAGREPVPKKLLGRDIYCPNEAGKACAWHGRGHTRTSSQAPCSERRGRWRGRKLIPAWPGVVLPAHGF